MDTVDTFAMYYELAAPTTAISRTISLEYQGRIIIAGVCQPNRKHGAKAEARSFKRAGLLRCTTDDRGSRIMC